MKSIYLCLAVVILASCSPKPEKALAPVVVSLLGKSYYEPERSPSQQAKLDSALTIAKTNWEKDPSEENYIWYGRRLGYLSRFQEAIDVFTEGIAKYPNSPKLYRHRGHRYISMRLFDRAIDDLSKATTLQTQIPWLEIEPDGVPNKVNKPLSSTQFNIWYHLALAHYLKGDFNNAMNAYYECLKTSDNDDLLIACVDWMYMTYQRMGRKEEAASILGNVHDGMNIIENDSYYLRCKMYQGKLPPDSLLRTDANAADVDLDLATQGYGVGNWYLYQGDSARAKAIFEKVVAGKHFGAFGFIAAEAELARWPAK